MFKFNVIIEDETLKFYLNELKFKINMIKLSSKNQDIHELSILIGFIPFLTMFMFLGQVTLVYFIIAFLASFTYQRSKESSTQCFSAQRRNVRATERWQVVAVPEHGKKRSRFE